MTVPKIILKIETFHSYWWIFPPKNYSQYCRQQFLRVLIRHILNNSWHNIFSFFNLVTKIRYFIIWICLIATKIEFFHTFLIIKIIQFVLALFTFSHWLIGFFFLLKILISYSMYNYFLKFIISPLIFYYFSFFNVSILKNKFQDFGF